MGLLAIFLAKLFDPIGAVIAMGISQLSAKRWIILVATITSAVTTETLLSVVNLTFTWGSSLIPAIVAAAVWASLGYWIRQRRKSKAAATEQVEDDKA